MVLDSGNGEEQLRYVLLESDKHKFSPSETAAILGDLGELVGPRKTPSVSFSQDAYLNKNIMLGGKPIQFAKRIFEGPKCARSVEDTLHENPSRDNSKRLFLYQCPRNFSYQFPTSLRPWEIFSLDVDITLQTDKDSITLFFPDEPVAAALHLYQELKGADPCSILEQSIKDEEDVKRMFVRKPFLSGFHRVEPAEIAVSVTYRSRWGGEQLLTAHGWMHTGPGTYFPDTGKIATAHPNGRASSLALVESGDAAGRLTLKSDARNSLSYSDE